MDSAVVADVRRLTVETVRSAEEWQRDAGRGWYGAACDLAAELGRKLEGRDRLRRAAAIIAVLSPQISWAQNVKVAHSIVAKTAEGFGGAFRRNVAKAIRLRDATSFDDSVVSGRKVSAFADNIWRPDVSLAVTLDRVMMRHFRLGARMLERKGVYQLLSLAVSYAAADLSRDGVLWLPHQVQATVWIVERGGAE